ncbi:MAG: CRISPR-associated protein [Saprospiraceae bacterium]|nr:CRISPR-associated protein [Saprospiraceae bacterium]
MLINISNHPSVLWSKKQKETAIAQFGDIQDMTFPQISPLATSDEVVLLAQEYQQKITTNHTKETTTIHLMGELTFTFALVKLLQEKGFTVVCSTTKRLILAENTDTKTAKFQFQTFRAYPKL